MLERYVYKNQKKMRCGYTTGTCACAAAKAAACMLLSGRRIESVSVITPMGVELTLPVYEITMEQDSVTCAIKKDSGDDPDVTNGILIYASVSYIETSFVLLSSIYRRLHFGHFHALHSDIIHISIEDNVSS